MIIESIASKANKPLLFDIVFALFSVIELLFSMLLGVVMFDLSFALKSGKMVVSSSLCASSELITALPILLFVDSYVKLCLLSVTIATVEGLEM